MPWLVRDGEVLASLEVASSWRDRRKGLMGRDGLEGAKAVKAAGGRILVEAESTCTVYGMPRAVAEAGLADSVLPLDQLADAIAKEL